MKGKGGATHWRKKIERTRGEGGGRHRYRHVEGDVPMCTAATEQNVMMAARYKLKPKAQAAAALKQTRHQVRRKK